MAIASIVEGHGEVEAIRILLTRICAELIRPAVYPTILKPVRVHKSKVASQEGELLRAVDLAILKLSAIESRGLVLLLLDSDDDKACTLAPALTAQVRNARSHVDFACVLAVVEYETWFVAGATSLNLFLSSDSLLHVPADPEAARAGKGWIERFFLEPKYSETVDQPRLTAAFDLPKARENSLSFDKLCRELEKRIHGEEAPND
ncbi:MAG TPA: DUF4276 family protein [Thermoanaerobaculia bacterium]|nr:DUF4276 family protein [Thermoanaerobaculia bacterium]